MDELNQAIALFTGFFPAKTVAISAAQGIFVGCVALGISFLYEFVIAPGGSFFHAKRTSAKLISASDRLERSSARADGLIVVAKLQIDGLSPRTGATSIPAASGISPAISGSIGGIGASVIPPPLIKPPNSS